MNSVEFIGHPTEDGHLMPEDPKYLKAVLKDRFKKGARPLRVIMEDWKPEQSDAQRALWFVNVVKPFCERMGHRFQNEHEKLLVHHEIMVKLGRFDTLQVFGKPAHVPHSMKKGKMTFEQFRDLYDDAQILGAEWDAHVRSLTKLEIETLKAAQPKAETVAPGVRSLLGEEAPVGRGKVRI